MFDDNNLHIPLSQIAHTTYRSVIDRHKREREREREKERERERKREQSGDSVKY